MKIHIQHKIYAALTFGLTLLLGSLVINYNNIDRTNQLLGRLEKNHIQLNYYTNKLNYDIKHTQVILLQEILLHNSITNTQDAFDPINSDIKKLEQSISKRNALPKEFLTTLKKMKSRVVAYKLVRKSLIEALKSEDKTDLEDALIGFNSITLKFSQETTKLIKLVNGQLHNQIIILKRTNTNSLNLILFSFALSTIILVIALYKFNTLQKNLTMQLKRAQEAEEELKKSELKLLSYNLDLKQEVDVKSKELQNKIYTNRITLLNNRNKLLEDIQEYNFSFIAALNIDRFQAFNDIYGEKTGNIALKLTGDFLQKEVDDLPLLIYHIGGDEFAIVCIQNISIDYRKFVDKIQNILDKYAGETFQHKDQTFNFTMSAGIANIKGEKMLAYADMALKDAKQKNIPLVLFNEDKNLEKYHKEDMKWRSRIEYALEQNTILSYFQPIIPIQDEKKATKYESLVRLKDENGKVHAPYRFLDVARKNKLYNKITYRVINNTLDVITRYQIPCSLNMALSDIGNEETTNYLFETLSQYPYNSLLSVELLETEEFEDYEYVLNFCQKLKEFNVKIAIDDFGSGYSNFARALKLPVDYLKIDASLISNIDKDRYSKAMVEGIVDLAKKLEIETIAEFVATKEILETVKEVGVDYAQGYYLGKPLSIDEYLPQEGVKRFPPLPPRF